MLGGLDPGLLERHPGHHEAEDVAVGVAGDDADDPAPVHHGDPVGERHDLVELAGDEQDGGAGVPLGDEPLVDELDGPDVHATGGLGGDEDAQRPGHLPCHDHLLLVAAGEPLGGLLRPAGTDVELRDAGDPVEIAARYNAQGADELTFLDITATSDGRDLILPIIEAVASQVFIPLTVGGGVRTVEDVRRLLNAGADKTSFNSAAIADPGVISAASAKYGAQCIVVAIDAKRRPDGSGWDVYSHGGRKNTGLDAVQWATEMARRGAGEILLTSMDRDGTKAGFDLALTRAVSDAVSVPVIASGGVGNLDHLADGVQQGGADAVLAASIFHYGEYTVGQAKQRMAERGIPVRL